MSCILQHLPLYIYIHTSPFHHRISPVAVGIRIVQVRIDLWTYTSVARTSGREVLARPARSLLCASEVVSVDFFAQQHHHYYYNSLSSSRVCFFPSFSCRSYSYRRCNIAVCLERCWLQGISGSGSEKYCLYKIGLCRVHGRSVGG